MTRTRTLALALGLLSTTVAAAISPLGDFRRLSLGLFPLGAALSLVALLLRSQPATQPRPGAVPLAFLGIVLVAGSASFGANIGYAMNTCPGVFSYTRYVVTATEGSVAAFLSIAAALSLAAGFARRFHLSRLQFTLWVIAVLVVPVASLGLSFGLARALHCR